MSDTTILLNSTSTTTTTTTTSASSKLNLENEKISSFKKLKESEDFYRRLIEFHRHKNVNTPLIQLPTLNGKLIDLHKLYNIVISMGGWERVCDKDKWTQVGLELDSKLFKTCLNGSHALKIIYIRYLSLYEKFDYQMSYSNSISQGASISSLLEPLYNFNNHSLPHAMSTSVLNGPNVSLNGSNHLSTTLGYHKNSVPNLEDNLDSDLNRRRFSYLLELTPMNYNYAQHQPCLNIVNNPYEKMEISLLSGLPNEIDFVFNTLLLLSSDESHMFKIYQSSRLIELMLAHCGFFGSDDKYNLRNLYDNYWNKNEPNELLENNQEHDELKETFETFLKYDYLEMLSKRYIRKYKLMNKRNFIKFWHDTIQIPDNEEFNQSNHLQEIMPKLYNQYLKNLPQQELLNLREIKEDSYDNSLETSVEYRRIEQVLVTINNLSFEDNNATFMATKCPSLLEFLIMCLYSTYSDVRVHALDILANLSRKIKLKLLSDKHKTLLITSLYHLIIGFEEKTITQLEPNYDQNIVNTKLLSNQDHLDLIRGLEILTKLSSQEQLDTLDDDFINEKILAKYTFYFNDKNTCTLFLEKIFNRIEELLSLQDILILLHSLEFLYNISQFNELICNLIVGTNSNNNNNNKSKIITILMNFLTVDMSHFGCQIAESGANISKQPSNASIKMYKIMPTNGTVIASSAQTTTNTNLNQPNNTNNIINNAKPNNLPPNNSVKVINSQQNNQNTKNANNEQHAKNILCNWLVTCFQADSNSELSKTQLYPYYQQISKLNNWSVLTIPTFFEILNATFPHLRYDEETNKIHGLKLVLNLKQQLELKQKFKNLPSTPIIQTQSTQNVVKTETKPSQEQQFTKPISISPPPSVNINIQTPSIPLLTPPTPPVTNNIDKQKEENIVNSTVLTNGSNKANLLNGNSNSSNEALTQNEDSLSSNSSSSNSSCSSSNKVDKENDSVLKRKIEINSDISQSLKVTTNENSSDSNLSSSKSQTQIDSNSNNQTCTSTTVNSSLGSPQKKKKLKINEMEEFMNKPMNSITIVSNQVVIQNQSHSKQAITQPMQEENDQHVNSGDYLCEWNNCNRYFTTSKAVYNHVCKYHLLSKNLAEIDGHLCLWSGCDQIKRQKWSLINHLLERHCNENAMKNAISMRQRGIIPTPNNQTLSSNYLNYSKDAALFAIQRHHKVKKEDFASPEEGPITKSIRLLSALILRNLARNSDKAKELIKAYEPQLANIAFDLLESSNAVSNCLWHLAH